VIGSSKDNLFVPCLIFLIAFMRELLFYQPFTGCLSAKRNAAQAAVKQPAGSFSELV
jgi:hypothetical protein